MAKLNLAKVVETGKIAGLTTLDAIIDGLGVTGETIEKVGHYISEKWKDNQTRVVVLREMNEHVKEWNDFRELKERKQALKDIPRITVLKNRLESMRHISEHTWIECLNPNEGRIFPLGTTFFYLKTSGR